MTSKLPATIKQFGLIDGLQIYMRLKNEKPGWYKTPKAGSKVYLRKNSSDHYTFKQVFVENQYNIHLPFQPKNIIDAGANIGLAALYFAERYPQSQIIAIEPSSNNFESILKKHCILQKYFCNQ